MKAHGAACVSAQVLLFAGTKDQGEREESREEYKTDLFFAAFFIDIL